MRLQSSGWLLSQKSHLVTVRGKKIYMQAEVEKVSLRVYAIEKWVGYTSDIIMVHGEKKITLHVYIDKKQFSHIFLQKVMSWFKHIFY